MGARARLTSKGQITIPKDVREQLGLRAGDDVEFVAQGGAIHIRKIVAAAPFRAYRSYLRKLRGRDPDELIQEARDG